jgi:hypothetical protein
MNILRIITTSLALFAFASVSAQPKEEAKTNGCGTGWNRYLIPDKIQFLGCDFKSACDAHDVCYGQCTLASSKDLPQCQYLRCLPGGDLYGKPRCEDVPFGKLKLEAESRRAKCDGSFLVDLASNNLGKPKCTLLTALYPFAVRVLGSSAFLGMESVELGFTENQKVSYANAVNRVLAEWTDEKIREYVDKLKSGVVKVDFSKEIRFDPSIGLINVEPTSK